MSDRREPTRFENFPGDVLRDAFLVHVKETGSPETFPGICTDRPPEDWEFEIISGFRINPLKRAEGEMAPCPVCSPVKPKFLDGVLVWDARYKVIRAIGNECGSNETKSKRDDAVERYRERQRQREIVSFLNRNLPQAGEALARCAQAQACAEHAQSLHDTLRKNAPTFAYAVLDETNKNGGQFTRHESFTDAEGKQQATVIRLGAPKGLGFLRTKYHPVDNLRAAEVRLRAAIRGEPEEATAWLARLAADPQEYAQCHADLAEGLRLLEESEAQVRAAREFLTASNLALVARWGREANVREFACRHSPDEVYVRGASREGQRKEAYLHPDMRRLTLPVRASAA